MHIWFARKKIYVWQNAMHITTIHVLSELKITEQKKIRHKNVNCDCLFHTLTRSTSRKNYVLELDFIFPFVSLSFFLLPTSTSAKMCLILVHSHWRWWWRRYLKRYDEYKIRIKWHDKCTYLLLLLVLSHTSKHQGKTDKFYCVIPLSFHWL